MKETPLTDAFEDAMRRFSAESVQKHVAHQLETIQRTVLEFQEAGADVTLAVRPKDLGSELKEVDGFDSSAFLCNGDIVLGAERLEFAIAYDDYNECIDLKIFRGDAAVIERRATQEWQGKKWEDEDCGDNDGGPDWSRGDKRRSLKTDLASMLTRCLIEMKTEQDFVARFNVGSSGNPDDVLQKSFSVIPALTLKKPPSP